MNPLFSYSPHSSFDAQGYLLKSDEIFTKLNRRAERLPPPPAMGIRKSPEKQVNSASVSLPSSGAVFGNPPQSSIPIFGKSAPAPSYGFTPSVVFGGSNLTATAPTSLPSPHTPATVFQSFPNVTSTSIFPSGKNSTSLFGPSPSSGFVFGGPGFGSAFPESKKFQFEPSSAATAVQPSASAVSYS